MSDSELPPLPADLERLFARANAAPERAELVDQVRAHVANAMVLRGLGGSSGGEGGASGASSGGGAPGRGAPGEGASELARRAAEPAARAGGAAASSVIAKGVAAKIAVAAATAGLVVGAGAGHQWSARGQRAVVVDGEAGPSTVATSPVEIASAITAPPPSEIAHDEPLPSASARAPSPPHHDAPPSDAPSDDARAGRSALRRERELLDGAAGALKSGNAAQALSLGEKHRAQFPGGQLAEEREVVVIEALLALGRRGEARARLDGFRKHFKGSAAIERLERRFRESP